MGDRRRKSEKRSKETRRDKGEVLRKRGEEGGW